MRMYELVLIFKDSLSEEKRKKLIETVKSWIKDMKVTKEDAWGVKAFAYPIKKEKSGYYEMMAFEGESGVPTDFEKRILANESILRHLLVRKK